MFASLQLKDIGSGNFGVAKLMRYKPTGELVAVKFIERGDKVPPPLPAVLHGWVDDRGFRVTAALS